ncbi:MAG: hypothetical protein Q4C12_07835 [Clostridia bacterium]|nr:hypothetical protein [Clostridia bacterium]
MGCLKFIVTCVFAFILLFLITAGVLYGAFILKDWDKYGINTTLWFSDEKHEYVDGGFGDVIKYSEYHFNKESIQKFTHSKWYKKVQSTDIEIIKGYFENYSGWIAQTEFADKYNFELDCINEGDFYYIYTLEGKPIGQSVYRKYDNYDVYFLDMETCTVYFIHANI